MSRAANDAAYQVRLEPVRVLRLNAGAERVPRHRERFKPDELWTGTAYGLGSDDADIPVYFRVCSRASVAAELACSVIGRALGLPIPEPFAVIVDKGVLPKSKRLDQRAPAQYVFGCLNVGGRDFAQLLNEDSDFALEMILRWKDLVPVTTFDEWLANTDRNLGNILFVARSLWLIDHADAFGGAQRNLYPLRELSVQSFENKLATFIEHQFDVGARRKHLDEARGWLAARASTINAAQAIDAASLAMWLTEGQQTELVDFITERLTITHSLLCTRLGHPQLWLSHPKDSDSGSAAGEASSNSVQG